MRYFIQKSINSYKLELLDIKAKEVAVIRTVGNLKYAVSAIKLDEANKHSEGLIKNGFIEACPNTISKVFKGDKTIGDFLSAFAYVLMDYQEYAYSVEMFSLAINAHPSNIKSYQTLLWLLLEDNTGIPINEEKARRILAKCLPHGKINADIHYNAACVYMELGEPDNALIQIELAIKREPDNILRIESMFEEEIFAPIAKTKRFREIFTRALPPKEKTRSVKPKNQRKAPIPQDALIPSFEMLLGKRMSSFSSKMKYELYFHQTELEYFNWKKVIERMSNNKELMDLKRKISTDEWPNFSFLDFNYDFAQSIGSIDSLLDALCIDDEKIFSEIELELVKHSVGRKLIMGHALGPIMKKFQKYKIINILQDSRMMWRIQTDGTLFDAMRAATWTFGGYEDLVPFADEVKVMPVWRKKIKEISDTRLREHFSMLCLDQESARGCDGAYFSGTKCSSPFNEVQKVMGYTPIASWWFGEGQAGSTLFQVKKT